MPQPTDRYGLADAIDGALAGAVATLPMSALMYAARRAGWMGEYPPVVIVDELLDALGFDRETEVDEVVATVAHLGFGAASGALFGVLDRALDPPGPGWARGIGFGLLVYLASYAGWVPGADILPPPGEDRPGRQPAMVAAHVVYGGVLAALLGATPRRR